MGSARGCPGSTCVCAQRCTSLHFQPRNEKLNFLVTQSQAPAMEASGGGQGLLWPPTAADGAMLVRIVAECHRAGAAGTLGDWAAFLKASGQAGRVASPRGWRAVGPVAGADACPGGLQGQGSQVRKCDPRLHSWKVAITPSFRRPALTESLSSLKMWSNV